MKDGKKHTATLQDVRENEAFTYTAPLPGSKLVAVHTLETVDAGTKITHTFDFTGMIVGGLFRLITAGYVQHGLDMNTVLLKRLAEGDTLVGNVPEQ